MMADQPHPEAPQPSAQAPDRLLPVRRVVERLGIGKTRTYELIASGELPAVRIGSKILVRSSDLDAYIDALAYVRPTVLGGGG